MRWTTALAVAVSLGGCAGGGSAPVIVKDGEGVVYREGVYDAADHRPAAGKEALQVASFGVEDVEVSVDPRRDGVGPILWIAFRPEVAGPCPGGGNCALGAFSRVSVLDRPNLAGTRPQSEAVWWTGVGGSCNGKEHRGRATILYRGTYHSMGNVRFFGPLRLLVESGKARVLEADYKTTSPGDPPHAPEFDRAQVTNPE